MSLSNNIPNISEIEKERELSQFQPEFPLVYDGIFGPYRPITGKVESIQKDFENLLQTSPGEWPFDPDLGIGLRHYLFEFRDSTKMRELEPNIRKQIERYLPGRIDLKTVEIQSSNQEQDESFATIKLNYRILSFTMADLAASLMSWSGKMRLTTVFHRGLYASGDVYKSNVLSNQIETI